MGEDKRNEWYNVKSHISSSLGRTETYNDFKELQKQLWVVILLKTVAHLSRYNFIFFWEGKSLLQFQSPVIYWNFILIVASIGKREKCSAKSVNLVILLS